MDFKIDNLQTKKNLNESIWFQEDNTWHIYPSIRKRLLVIAINFFKELKIPKESLKDIIFTGSMANYNWTKHSDIDLHLVVDFSLVDENYDLVKEYFNTVKSLWNDRHEITVKDFEVEIYVQDIKEPHYAAGIFSLIKNEWLVEPTLYKNARVNKKEIEKKATLIIKMVEKIETMFDNKEYKDAIKYSNLLTDKIRKMRKCGLSKNGEYSVENLTFKVLRKENFLQKLWDIKFQAYDKLMSLNENIAGDK